jgi:hypothetical protein
VLLPVVLSHLLSPVLKAERRLVALHWRVLLPPML